MKYAKCVLHHRVNVVLAALCLAVLPAGGCAISIPASDIQAPEIRLVVSGPGIGRHEMTNPPRAEWTAPDGLQVFDLVAGTEYHFTLAVNDQGGASRAELRMPVDFLIVEAEPGDTTIARDGVMWALSRRGSPADPRSALIITGTFRTPSFAGAAVYAFEFLAEGDDFGGAARRINQRFMIVHAAVSSRR